MVGGLVGFYTRMRREGAVSVAVGMTGAFVIIEDQLVVGIVAGVIYAGIGFLFSWAGVRIVQKKNG